MVGYDAKTISTLNDEELDLLIDILKQEKGERANLKREKLINAFQEAWEAIEAEGYDFYIQGEPLDFRDIEIY